MDQKLQRILSASVCTIYRCRLSRSIPSNSRKQKTSSRPIVFDDLLGGEFVGCRGDVRGTATPRPIHARFRNYSGFA